MKGKIIWVCGFLFLVGVVLWRAVVYDKDSTSGVSKVVLGAQTFLIPKENLLEVVIPAWLRQLPGLDDESGSFLVTFPALSVANSVPGYQVTNGVYREDISGVLSALTSDEARRYETLEHLAPLWYRNGSYRDAVVEPYGIAGWYKVYRKVEYPYSWALLKYLPSADESLPLNAEDFWVGHCLKGGAVLVTGGAHVTCRSFVYFDDVSVDFEVSEQNIKHIDEIRVFIKMEVLAWMRLPD